MKFIVLFSFILSATLVAAQPKLTYNYAKCNTRIADSGYYMKNAEAFLAKSLAERQSSTAKTDFNAPYVIRTFIRIVRESNGTLPGCSMATAIQNFNEMNGQYNGHNICFQLVGIDYINDSYLNNFVYDSLLGTDYKNYILQSNLDVDGAMTIFIHYNFVNSGSSGNAYGIPNHFLSVARWAAESNNVRSIFGHEMGHCLGLYHTFERNYDGNNTSIQESVTRTTNNSCYNCNSQGDLCCDTQADYFESKDYTNGSTCTYSRNLANACDNLQYNPSTVNIMSYMPWTCISTTASALTTDQTTRMHAAILDGNGPIYTRVAENNVVLPTLYSANTTVKTFSARTNITTANGASITQTAGAKAYYAAGNAVIFSPGVTFSPNANGIVNISISGCN